MLSTNLCDLSKGLHMDIHEIFTFMFLRGESVIKLRVKLLCVKQAGIKVLCMVGVTAHACRL